MKYALIALLLLMCMPVAADEFTYEGPWYTGVTEDGRRTGRRRLEGIMTCVVKSTGKDKWDGRFFGVWHGVKFSYDVKFTGKPNNLKGKATIDGASYTWEGKMAQESPGWFNGTL